MIFVTTGTQLAFPRLVSAMNRLAPELGEPVCAQVGPDPADYPELEVVPHLSPHRFEALIMQSRVVVAHAGIGTILTARRHHKPLILMARRHHLGEHRNDHQMATLDALKGRPGLYATADAEGLGELLRRGDLQPATPTPGVEVERLMSFVKEWISGCG